MGDGKLYFLIYTVYFTGEEGYQEDIWETTSVLVFDFDDEVATTIAIWFHITRRLYMHAMRSSRKFARIR
jgi:hypothetical protein